MTRTQSTALTDLWEFNDPAASEWRFREAAAQGRALGDSMYEAEALTQVARALGLQRKFGEADAVLDEVAGRMGASPCRASIRLALERGRLRNSSGDRAASVPLFVQAHEAAKSLGEEFLEVDAAHMLGIASASPEERRRWNDLALERARCAVDPKARNWRGSILNNIGWERFDAGEFEGALEQFQEALRARVEEGSEERIRIARWCVARTLRALGRLEEALSVQRGLAEELRSAHASDGFVDEELAECLLALGRAEESKPHFAAAHARLSKDPWLSANQPERIARLKSLSEAVG